MKGSTVLGVYPIPDECIFSTENWGAAWQSVVPDIEVGEGLEVADSWGNGANAVMVQAKCFQGDELAELLR